MKNNNALFFSSYMHILRIPTKEYHIFPAKKRNTVTPLYGIFMFFFRKIFFHKINIEIWHDKAINLNVPKTLCIYG